MIHQPVHMHVRQNPLPHAFSAGLLLALLAQQIDLALATAVARIDYANAME